MKERFQGFLAFIKDSRAIKGDADFALFHLLPQ
jgi:hypothetical protein